MDDRPRRRYRRWQPPRTADGRLVVRLTANQPEPARLAIAGRIIRDQADLHRVHAMDHGESIHDQSTASA